MIPMLKIAGTSIAAAALVLGGLGTTVAVAANYNPAACHVASQESHTESRDVTGQQAQATKVGPIRKVVTWRNGVRRVIYVRTVTRYTFFGTQTRTVTVTQTRCANELTTSTTATPWAGAKIVTTSTTQRVR